MGKWLRIFNSIWPLLARLQDPATWREPSTWSSLATAVLSAVAVYFGLSDEQYETLLAGIVGGISSVAGVLLPERGGAVAKPAAEPMRAFDLPPDHHPNLDGKGFGDK